MIEQYYTPEQLEHFKKSWEANPEQAAELARQGTAAWAELWSQLAAEMEKGTDPGISHPYQSSPRSIQMRKRDRSGLPSLPWLAAVGRWPCVSW